MKINYVAQFMKFMKSTLSCQIPWNWKPFLNCSNGQLYKQ